MKHSRAHLPGDPARRERAPMPPSIDDIVLTPEEEAFLDDDFLRESVARAIEAVRKVESHRSMRVRALLAMRDLLFARWIENLSPTDLDLDFSVSAAALSDIPTPRLIDSGKVEIPQEARVFQRIHEYIASETDFDLDEYKRIVQSVSELEPLITERTTDEQLTELLETVAGT